MTFTARMLTLGIASTNCYILGDEQTGDAVLIDPSDDAPRLLDVIARERWQLRLILATHAHFDHVLALRDVKAATNIPFRMHQADEPLLQALPIQMQRFTGKTVPAAPMPDSHLNEGDIVEVGSIRLEVRFTPGHAPGHVIFISHEQKMIFGGDCLFMDSIGRTDLPGGDYDTLLRSIFSKLMTLPDDYTLASGHGAMTTIGRERSMNPFLLDWEHEHPH
jgi:hydroxyacylglutathione hydrolase